jgi:hypothetical protein
LGAGNASIKTTTKNIPGQTAPDAAAAAINSAGQEVALFSDYNGPDNWTVQLNGLKETGSVTLKVYMVDNGTNLAQSPIETITEPVTGGSTTLVLPMNAQSVAGIVVGSGGPTSTPTQSPVHRLGPNPTARRNTFPTFRNAVSKIEHPIH